VKRVTSSCPADCPSKRVLDGLWMGSAGLCDGDGWGPKAHPNALRMGRMGFFFFFGWAFPGNVVVPFPPVRVLTREARRRDRRGVILGRLGRFIFRNLVLKPCDHTIGSRTWVFAREQQCPFWPILQPLV